MRVRFRFTDVRITLTGSRLEPDQRNESSVCRRSVKIILKEKRFYIAFIYLLAQRSYNSKAKHTKRATPAEFSCKYIIYTCSLHKCTGHIVVIYKFKQAFINLKLSNEVKPDTIFLQKSYHNSPQTKQRKIVDSLFNRRMALFWKFLFLRNFSFFLYNVNLPLTQVRDMNHQGIMISTAERFMHVLLGTFCYYEEVKHTGNHTSFSLKISNKFSWEFSFLMPPVAIFALRPSPSLI